MVVAAQSALIVGAGPTGLCAALALADRGFDVRVIEKHAARLPYSRALVVNPSSLDLLDTVGAAEAIITAGVPVQKVAIRGPSGKVATMTPPVPASHAKSLILLPQYETEMVLERAALARGISIVRPAEVRALRSLPDRVELDITREGIHETLVARWLVGADGFHSFVRQQLGIAYEVETLPNTWTRADATGDWPFEEDIAVWLLDEGMVGAFHMGGRNIALASTLEKFTHLMPELRLSTPSWQAAFQIHFAQAPHYGRDTVWLAGDAAHVHSPVGGRGMNMGMADAFALAGAISAERPQDYEQMRHPITADFIRLNRRMSAIPALQGMSGALVRRAARFMAAHFTDTVRRTVGQVAGL